MKFLIQKHNGNLHDFSFTLLESIRFKNWLTRSNDYKFKFLKTSGINDECEVYFKQTHENYIPIGSVEFVTKYLQRFYNLTPKPINVPSKLFTYADRHIFNGNHMDLEDKNVKYFIKSNTKIKKFTEIIDCKHFENYNIPADNYQISEVISIDSEWRTFVYENKIVGLQNYCGEFTVFPNVEKIREMINTYKSIAPIAYTLDIGISNNGNYKNTFIIEIHDFFSCGLYGFANHAILPSMYYKWFKEYIKNNII